MDVTVSKEEILKELRSIYEDLAMYISSDPVRFRVNRARLELWELIDRLEKEKDNA